LISDFNLEKRDIITPSAVIIAHTIITASSQMTKLYEQIKSEAHTTASVQDVKSIKELSVNSVRRALL